MARGHRGSGSKATVPANTGASRGTAAATKPVAVAPAEVAAKPVVAGPVEATPTKMFDGVSAREAIKRADPVLWKFEKRRNDLMAKIAAAGAEVMDAEEILKIDVRAAGIIAAADQRVLVAAAQAGSDRARHVLTVANQGMVYQIAHTYKGHGVNVDDLAQEGNLGLQDAIAKYNFEFADKARFLTYAHWWIRRYVAYAVQEQGGQVRLPNYLHLVRVRTKQAERALENRGVVNPSRQQIHDEVQARSAKPVPAEHIDASIEVLGRRYVSFNQSQDGGRDGGNASDLNSVIPDMNVDMDESFHTAALQDAVADGLEVLTPLQRAIVSRRFGIDGKKETMARDIQAELGITKGQFDNQLKRALTAMREKVEEHDIDSLDAVLTPGT